MKPAARPRAAPWHFPYRDHRTCAEVNAPRCRVCGQQRRSPCQYGRCPIEAEQ